MAQDPDDMFDDLFAAWSDVLHTVVLPLLKTGEEGSVLHKLAAHPQSAVDLAWSDMQQDEHLYRKVAAELIGRVGGADPDLLRGLWEVERARMEDAKDDFEAALSDSVGESIVWAAAKWIQRPHQMHVARAVLEDYVVRALSGQPWKNIGDALATLSLHDESAAEPLVRRAIEYCRRSGDDQLSHCERVASGEVYDLRRHLDAQNAGDAGDTMSSEHRQAVDVLLELAARYEDQD